MFYAWIFVVVSLQMVSSYRLNPRSDLSSRDIRLRCCHNRWSECCKAYPWEGQGRNSAAEDDEGSASGSGSGSGELQYTKECKKYNTPFFKFYYGNKCVNNYVLFRDVRRVRNIIAVLYRCNVKKDEEFYKALMKVEEDMTPDGKRCCEKHVEVEGIDRGVAYAVGNMLRDLENLEKDYRLHQSYSRIPCHLYGHTLTIEHKLSEAIWEMGLYIYCGREGACPLPR